MTIIAVNKMWSTDGGTVTTPKADATDKQYAITEGYQVTCTADTTFFEVQQATGVPQNGDQHSSGEAVFVTASNPTRISPIFWQVIIGYEGESPDPDAVEVEWSDVTSTEPIDRDYSGKAILTVNGEQVDGLTMEVPDQIAVITKKYRTIDLPSVAAYRNATNSDTFLGWPPGTARLIGFSARNRYKYNQPQEQWTVTARIQFRKGLAGATDAQAWYKRWRHEGFYVKSGSIVVRALDDNGQETVKPVLLKSDGTQETDPAAALFYYTQVYGSLPYSGLGLL